MTQTANPPQIEANDLSDDAVILDVRDQDQWDAGHAPGAIHIPIAQLPARLAELPGTTRPLPVTCGGGTKGKHASALLIDAGIDAVELRGGMRSWKATGRPLVTD
ncbi:MAG: rhodanese-like domain-containing protein [Nostocoides sp.]